jgi:hypothetical protein
MQGPTHRWDQPPDPRESTVNMPRIDPSLLADQVSEPAAAAHDRGAGMELPGFGDPYARPARASASAPAASPAPAEPALPDERVEPVEPGHPGAASRGAGPPPRRGARRAEPREAATPPPGSIAELRGRLERLPDGHPSSPYDDAGWLKPSPTRLRQLELGLPARSRGAPAGYADRFGIDPDDNWLNDGVPVAAAAGVDPQAGTPGEELPGTAEPAAPDADDALADARTRRSDAGRAAAADLPQGLAAPEAMSSSHPARPAANGHRDPSDGPGQLRLQHPYAGAADHVDGDNDSGARDLAQTRLPGHDTAADRESTGADHRNGHLPTAPPPDAGGARPVSPERESRQSDQAPGGVPRRGDRADAARQRLTPDLRDLVDRALAAYRAAEGRHANGGYGTSGLTPALRRIAAQLPAGGLAPGSESDTLKPADRFATRLARLIERQPGRPPAELAASISDGIRYAFTFPATDYTEGTLLVHRKLKAQGFDLEARRNQWDSREYKGVFTRWRDPAHGLAFEVQFHTTDSWAVVKQTHDAYLQITDPVTPAAERARLRARQAAAAATVIPPAGCMDIADFRAGER